MLKKVKKILENNYKWIILFLCTILFLTILEDVFEYEKLTIDNTIYHLVVEKMRTPTFTNILKVITNLGSAYILIPLCLFILTLFKNKKIGICISLNLMLSTLLNIILKNIVQRPRPEGYRLIDESGYSFPSGHSMVNTAFYGLIFYLIFKNVKNKKLKYISCSLIALLIFMIGLSRIYLGVHYASDVIAGFLISIAYLIVFTSILHSILILKKGEKD